LGNWRPIDAEATGGMPRSETIAASKLSCLATQRSATLNQAQALHRTFDKAAGVREQLSENDEK